MEKSEKISILQDVVKIKSVNGNEEEVAIYLQNLLKKYEMRSLLNLFLMHQIVVVWLLI